MPLDRSETARWLKRLLVKGVERRHWDLLARESWDPDEWGSWSEGWLCRIGRLSMETARGLKAGVEDGEVEAELLAMEGAGARLCMRFDRDFPYLLSQMSVPPPAIYVAGDLASDDELAVAVVGPRKPTPYGREIARRLAVGLARAGITVVSGFAVGVDSVAHRAAVEAGGRTIGVLGCGLSVNYPPSHGELRQVICEGGGALVSEYSMAAKPLAHHFPPRNTIIAGLSLAVIVVEAAERSGALVTARAALEENRHVYAVPGDITRSNSKGSNALLRAGAIPLTGVDDLLEDLEEVLRGTARRLEAEGKLSRSTSLEPVGIEASPASGGTSKEESEAGPGGGALPARTASGGGLPEDPGARLLLERVARDPMIDLDTLMAELVPDPFDVGRLSTLLLQLELSGCVRQLPGKLYVAT